MPINNPSPGPLITQTRFTSQLEFSPPAPSGTGGCCGAFPTYPLPNKELNKTVSAHSALNKIHSFAEVFALMDWFFFFFFEGCIHPRYCAEAGRIGNNVSAFTVPVEHFYCSNFCGFSILILQIEIHSFQKSNLSYFHKLFPLLPLCLAEWLSSLPHVNLCAFEDLKQVGFGNQSFSWQCHITPRINTSFTYTDSSLETPGFELSAYLKNILSDFFFKCSHREQDMSLPAPGQLPASSNCVTQALGSGRNKHLLIPHVPSPLLLCAHRGSETKHLLISDHLVFIDQQKATTVSNVEQHTLLQICTFRPSDTKQWHQVQTKPIDSEAERR